MNLSKEMKFKLCRSQKSQKSKSFTGQSSVAGDGKTQVTRINTFLHNRESKSYSGHRYSIKRVEKY
jgi:hypothetical protein